MSERYTDHDLQWLEGRINSEAGPQLAPYLIRLLGEYRLARVALNKIKNHDGSGFEDGDIGFAALQDIASEALR